MSLESDYILGLDVSTSTIGLCVIKIIDSEFQIVHIDKIDFKKCNNLWEKADKVNHELKAILNKTPGNYKVFLEEPLMGFRPGMSSAATITTLMRFNGIVSYISRDIFKIDPEYISSSHARKLCGIKIQRTSIVGINGKEQVFKYMAENDLSGISWPLKKNGQAVEWSRDATDAYVIAKAAFLENKIKNI